MKTPSEKALALCHAIEAAGASEQLTKCSVLASDLRADILRTEERDRRLAASLTLYAAECFPDVVNGQKQFVRVLMESWAEEVRNAEVAPAPTAAEVGATEGMCPRDGSPCESAGDGSRCCDERHPCTTDPRLIGE